MQRNHWLTGNVYDPSGVLVYRWDDDSRTFTDYTVEPPASRPYTEAENTEADEFAKAQTDEATRRTIEEALAQALTTMQALLDTPNATLNAGPGPFLKDLARVNRRVIRLLTRRLDGTA
jgi:hypothetical protein